jgi:sulfite exporter TauE/SafE
MEVASRREVMLRMVAYHFGRLCTYLAMGIFVACLIVGGGWSDGVLGQHAVNVGRIIGSALIVIAAFRLCAAIHPRVLKWTSGRLDFTKLIHEWGAFLARVRSLLPMHSGKQAAFAWGLTTTLLPCGWLYLFVLTAAASTSAFMAIATMIAFWIGTLPLLSISLWGWKQLGEKWRPASGWITNACILGMGLYLLISRSSVDPIAMHHALREPKTTAPARASTSVAPFESEASGVDRLIRIQERLEQGLPCCKH